MSKAATVTQTFGQLALALLPHAHPLRPLAAHGDLLRRS
jgi:hypothetical protein